MVSGRLDSRWIQSTIQNKQNAILLIFREGRWCGSHVLMRMQFQDHQVTPGTGTEEEEEDSSMEPSVRPRLTSRSLQARHPASTARLCEAVSSTREHSRGVRPGPVAGQVLGLTLSHLMMTSLKWENLLIIALTSVPRVRRKIFWTPHMRKRKEETWHLTKPIQPSAELVITWQITCMT